MTLKLSSAAILLAAIAACSTPPPAASTPNEPAAEAPTPTAPEANPTTETVAEPEADTIAQTPESVACVTWAEYRPYFAEALADNNLDAVPYMPPGFESGCVFRVGMGMGSSVSILRDGMALNDLVVSAAGTPATDGPIPWLEGNQVDRDRIDTLVAEGDIATFYEACVTNGGYASNCEGFPEEEAYVLDDNTACYDGRCLNAMDTHGAYLLAMWPWPNEIYDLPQSFSPADTAARLAYETVPLNQLPEQVSTYGQPDEIAFELFGRTFLEEGMQPTEVSGSWQNEPDGLYVVYLTNDGMADDSVGGLRYRLDFVSADGDMQKLVWVGRQNRCVRGSSPGWTKERCP